MADLEFTIENRELQAQLEKLVRALPPSAVEPVLLEGAKDVAGVARTMAPRGVTGNLKRGQRGKLLARRSRGTFDALGLGEGQAAPAIAASDYRIAPHAHLVEYGTGERIGGARSKRYSGRRFGRMPATPFLGPAWRQRKGPVLNRIIDRLRALLDAVTK